MPYSTAKNHWSRLADLNGWKAGEYASITLLADSGAAVDGLRQRLETLGFQAQTFGDLFRGFEDLLTRLRIALLALAVVRLLEIIGEAAGRVPPEEQARRPSVPWSSIVGLRTG